MNDPLEQFVIKPLFHIPYHYGSLPFTNAAFSMFLAVIIAFFIFARASQPYVDGVPNRLQMIIEIIYNFVGDIVKNNIKGENGVIYFPYVFSLFTFVLIGNLVGLFPFMYTFTSQLIVTFAMAFIVFMMALVLGIMKNGTKVFHFFLPPGTPKFAAPLLVPIEILSFLSRPVSLSVRLFANMVAGHAILKIFAGFVVVLVGSHFAPFALLPFALDMVMMGFECVVCFLQAYVFSILSCIYINDMINLH